MADSSILIILLIASPIVFGLITNSMGDKKGIRNGFWWGFFLGIIGVIIVSMKESKEPKKPKNISLDTLIKAKKKLNLQLITQQEYDVIKEQYKEQNNFV